MSQYPRDEFDRVPETASRQGVHRQRLVASRTGGLGLIILVGVLALLVGLAAYYVLPRLGIATLGNGDSEDGDGGTPMAIVSTAVTHNESGIQ